MKAIVILVCFTICFIEYSHAACTCTDPAAVAAAAPTEAECIANAKALNCYRDQETDCKSKTIDAKITKAACETSTFTVKLTDTCDCLLTYWKASRSNDNEKCTASTNLVTCVEGTTSGGCDTETHANALAAAHAKKQATCPCTVDADCDLLVGEKCWTKKCTPTKGAQCAVDNTKNCTYPEECTGTPKTCKLKACTNNAGCATKAGTVCTTQKCELSLGKACTTANANEKCAAGQICTTNQCALAPTTPTTQATTSTTGSATAVKASIALLSMMLFSVLQ